MTLIASTRPIAKVIKMAVRNPLILCVVPVSPDIMARRAECKSGRNCHQSQPDAHTQQYLPNCHVLKAPSHV